MDNKSDIGRRMKEFRSKTGLTQAIFAGKIGRSQSAIGDIESGRQKPSRKLLELMNSEFSLSADWLISGQGNPIAPRVHTDDSRITLPASDKPFSGDIVIDGQEVSLIKRFKIDLSAGAGIVLDEEHQDGAIAFSQRWLSKNLINEQLSGLVRVQGDSMYPTVPDGALVLVHAAEMEVKREAIYAIALDGEGFIKRLVPSNFDESGRPRTITVISDNHAYPSRVLADQELNTMRVVGRVRCAMIDF